MGPSQDGGGLRYYEAEHRRGYAQIKERGLEQWSDLHEALDGFDDFPNRSFLERVMPPRAADQRTQVLEYGCGTGPAACFLAARGYEVHGVDLVPDAIELARRHAAERGLGIRFEVQDICRWDETTQQYDVVLDSYCLQSIVLDDDRAEVFDGVRRRLRAGGRFVLSTAVYDPNRDYGDDYFDAGTGIVWTMAPGGGGGARKPGATSYLPHRRHLTAPALRAELEGHGYRVVEQSVVGGDVVCVPRRPG